MTLNRCVWLTPGLVISLGCAGGLDTSPAYYGAGPTPAGADAGVSTSASGWDAGATPAADGGAGSGAWSADAGMNAGTWAAPQPAAGWGAAGKTGVAGSWAAAGAYAAAGARAPVSAAGSGGAAGAPAAASCDFRGLMQAKCGNATCHGAPAMTTGLDLTTAGLAARVKDREASGACADKLLVDPTQPEQSALYLKVTGSECGVKMPLGGSLMASEQECVLSWIEGL